MCVCARDYRVCSRNERKEVDSINAKKAANKLFRRYCSGAVADGEQKRQIASSSKCE